jgi:hypothetical protein
MTKKQKSELRKQDEGHDAANALEGGDVVVGFDGHGRCVGCGEVCWGFSGC